MFHELVVSGVRPSKTHKRWTIAVSALAQSALWGILLLVPLIYTEALPNGMLKTLIVAPPPPVSAHPLSPLRNMRARIIPLSRITAPTFVPRHVSSEASGPPVEYVERGSGDSASSNALIDLLHPPGPPASPASPAEERRGPLRVSEGVEAASIINRVLPQYPEIARAAHVSGTVALRAIIARDGTVQELEYVSGPGLLIKPAIDAVKQWRYRPTMLNGIFVEVETTIDVLFTLGS
jgi:protein TonB